jgi:cell division protease FtsH
MESIKGELMDRYVLSKDDIFVLLEERLDPIPLQQAA